MNNIFHTFVRMPIELSIHTYPETLFSGQLIFYTKNKKSQSFLVGSHYVTIPDSIPFSIKLPTAEESLNQIEINKLLSNR